MPKKEREIGHEIRFEIKGILLLAFSILCLVSIAAVENSSLLQGSKAIGPIGSFLVRIFNSMFGRGKYLFACLLAIHAFRILKEKSDSSFNSRSLGMILLLLNILAFLHLKYMVIGDYVAILKMSLEGVGGGFCGAVAAIALYAGFGKIGSYVVLSTLCLISILLVAGTSLSTIIVTASKEIKNIYLKLRNQLLEFLFTTIEEEKNEDLKNKKIEAPVIISHENVKTDIQLERFNASGEDKALVIIQEEPKKKTNTPKKIPGNGEKNRELLEGTDNISGGERSSEYFLPPLELLQSPARAKNLRGNKDITDTVKLLEETLESFGIKVKVTQVSCGPAITRYEAQPAPGVRVSKIVSLADDIALSLASPHVRIEAPIPGKAAVGIEVPNKEVAMVSFKEVLETPEFGNSASLLTVAFGKDIAGNPIIADLSKMPHLLIAGATGSGKSVCMNSLICSLLFKCKPNELKFLMIDPKMVELTTYNGIPHLVAPVVTDAKKSATALRWMVNEMENRYALFAASGVKDIYRYNKLKQEEEPEGPVPALPFIVILIDELADLMMIAPADVEDAICRLAQMARAAGMHLVVATQRPSVDVITGIIKANIPSRVAFAVSSQTDSRTILDMGGAEKLLGRGDMLFYPVGMSKPLRVQGVYVSDKEVDAIVKYLRNQGQPEFLEGAAVLDNGEDNATQQYNDDELLPEATRLLIESGQASISLLQRRLRIGYTRAARLIDIMEDRGIVGTYEGSKPRSVLVNWDDYQKMFGKM